MGPMQRDVWREVCPTAADVPKEYSPASSRGSPAGSASMEAKTIRGGGGPTAAATEKASPRKEASVLADASRPRLRLQSCVPEFGGPGSSTGPKLGKGRAKPRHAVAAPAAPGVWPEHQTDGNSVDID